MSKDPNTPQSPPKAATPESLEDLVYVPSLVAGNKSVGRANPLVTIPLTIATWAACGAVALLLAKHTQAGRDLVKKTVGIDLAELKDEAPPPPPPPPPAPAAPAAPVRAEKVDAAPPPPINPSQDVVPEVAPKALPTRDLSMAYAGSGGSGSGVPGGGVAGTSGVAGGQGMAVAGANVTNKAVDFDFSQVKIKYQPPPPPYPPLAKLARIQGTVVVEITVGTDGIPINVVALEGPVQLQPASVDYAKRMKFEPCMQNGVAVVGRFKLTMPYRLTR